MRKIIISSLAILNIFYFLLMDSAEARISLHTQVIEDLVPANASMECLYDWNPKFGFIINRIGNSDKMTVEVISNGVSEGQQTQMDAVIKEYSIFVLYVSHHERKENEGFYTEFLINRIVDGSSLKYSGNVMFTEASYSLDEEGNEVESFHPLAKKSLHCSKVL